MKISLLRTSAAVAMVFDLGLAASVDADGLTGPGKAAGEQPAGAQVTVVTPAGGRLQSVAVERQRVRVGDGQTVTVLRPVRADDERAGDEAEDMPREVVTEKNEGVGIVDDLVFARVHGAVQVVLLGDLLRDKHRMKKKVAIPLKVLELSDQRVALLGVGKEKVRRLPRLKEGTLRSLARLARTGDRTVVVFLRGRSALGKLSGKRDFKAGFGKLHRPRDHRHLRVEGFGGDWIKRAHRSHRFLRSFTRYSRRNL